MGDAGQLRTQRFDVYINGYVAGNGGYGTWPTRHLCRDDAPLDGAVVMDTVYTPVETPLLKQAEAAGALTLDGLSMFVRQAGTQFKLWTGKALPVDVAEISPG